MHYDPRKKDHGLPHDPFTALIIPRPIGWISTVDGQGRVNLAPYSFFNALTSSPPFVMFASTNRKHSQANAEETDEFVANIASFDQRQQVNGSSAPVPAGVDEAALLGIEMVPSRIVRPPRVARAPAALECVRSRSIQLVTRDGQAVPTTVVIGEVVGVYINDDLIIDGRVDPRRMNPLARLGYLDYGLTDHIFEMKRPLVEDVMPK
jgi:flavin reductase (DIM6/NTAB) family NADH-FMN oxidoreductase RutF